MVSMINESNGYSYGKGNSLLDQRHRAVLSAVPTPPHLNFDSRLADAAINGWQLSLPETLATHQGVDPSLTLGTAVPRLPFTAPTLGGVGGEAPGTQALSWQTASRPLGDIARLNAANRTDNDLNKKTL